MKNFDWKRFAELVGITAIVVSLLFLGLQLKQTQDISVSEINASHHASLVELNNGFADHAGVWFRGNAGVDLDHEESTIYQALLHNLNEQHRIQWRHDRLFGRNAQGNTEHLEFAIFLHRNPGARAAWSADRDKSNASLRIVQPGFESRLFGNLVIDALKKLDEQSN
jgi:hypothetical protein